MIKYGFWDYPQQIVGPIFTLKGVGGGGVGVAPPSNNSAPGFMIIL